MEKKPLDSKGLSVSNLISLSRLWIILFLFKDLFLISNMYGNCIKEKKYNRTTFNFLSSRIMNMM